VKRFWIYQRERFPLVSHGLLIAAFSASAIAFSAFARHAALPAWWLLAAGFASSLLFFLQMRIADEWKDAAEDAEFRPYRPVPRGLVSLRELAWAGGAAGAVQFAVALAITPRLVPLLLGVWIYFALMSREFFVSRWLRAHPVAYIGSHMLIMPAIDFYVSSFDWLVAGVSAPHSLAWFLVVTFCNGLVVEIGRKIRAPRDEERGVETYSAMWGRVRATWIWCAAFAATAVLATIAAAHIDLTHVDAPIFGAVLVVAVVATIAFVRYPVPLAAKFIEALSGAWTVVMYTALGLLPFVVRGAF
jgi:4-hydroxybenzoate polyprenyltransferase